LQLTASGAPHARAKEAHMPAKDIVLDLAIRYGFQVLGALIILTAGVLAGRWIGRFVDGRLQRLSMEPPMRLLVVRVLKVVIMLFAAVVALDKFGFQIAPLVAGIGVAGLGVGFAMQGVLSNVMAGLTIIFTKPFRVGEYVELLGVRGDVAKVELFSTTLVHPDRSRVVIPNRKIVGEILHNHGSTRQVHLAVAVPHDTDLAKAIAVVAEVVGRNARVLKDPAPIIGIAQVTESNIKIAIGPWVRIVDVGPAEAEIYGALVEQFRARQIGLGLARQEIHVVTA
jgi:small conductance mechanosensitive channel